MLAMHQSQTIAVSLGLPTGSTVRERQTSMELIQGSRDLGIPIPRFLGLKFAIKILLINIV